MRNQGVPEEPASTGFSTSRRARAIGAALLLALNLLLVGFLLWSWLSRRQAREAYLEVREVSDPDLVSQLVVLAREPWPKGGTLEGARSRVEEWTKTADEVLGRFALYAKTRGRLAQGDRRARLERLLATEDELRSLKTEMARRIERLDEYWPRWDACQADLRQSEQYAELRIWASENSWGERLVVPQDGLLPLQKNEQGYWEFFVPATSSAEPGWEDAPEGARRPRDANPVVLMLLPGGTFDMGSNSEGRDEWPVHKVRIAPFFIAKYELTSAQWLAAGGSDSFAQDAEGYPLEGVGWEEASAWATGVGLALPTEAQWEYACRAGTSTHYWSGEEERDLADAGWYSGNSDVVHRIGEKPANGFGLHDMHGNVWEWCSDLYEFRVADGSRWAPSPPIRMRIRRGGSFLESAWFARSSFRNVFLLEDRPEVLGCRPARGVTTPGRE